MDIEKRTFIILMTIILTLFGLGSYQIYSYWSYHEGLRAQGIIEVFERGGVKKVRISDLPVLEQN